MASSFTIVPTFDSTITSLANAAAIESAINSAIGIYEATISSPVTVRITFGNMATGLGQSSFNLYDIPYSSFVTAAALDQTSAADATALAHLPAGSANPVTGTTDVLIKSANAAALNINLLNYLPPSFTLPAADGTVTLNTGLMNISRTGPQDSGKYDLRAVTMHEIDEILGLGSTLGLGLSAPFNNNPSPEDLFRYNGSGARSFTTSGSAYFSIDQTTNIAQFNNSAGADYGDWVAGDSPVRIQDAFGTPGAQPDLASAEIIALDVVGYTLTGSSPVVVPEPSTALLLGTGLAAGALFRCRRRKRAGRNHGYTELDEIFP